MKFVEDCAYAVCGYGVCGGTEDEGLLAGIRGLLEKVSIYIVPMVNPDGVELVLNGLSRSNPNFKELIRWNSDSQDFSKKWQANNNGVDLNHNYDALWEKSREAEHEKGIFGPGPTRYGGKCAESERESRAVANFTRFCDFDLVMALHSQGREIYFDFNGIVPPRGKMIGEAFERFSPYVLDKAEGISSFGGYKDWFIQQYNRPGYTVELGYGENPLPIEDFDEIYKETLPVLLLAAEMA